jgi:hypothetical protein
VVGARGACGSVQQKRILFNISQQKRRRWRAAGQRGSQALAQAAELAAVEQGVSAGGDTAHQRSVQTHQTDRRAAARGEGGGEVVGMGISSWPAARRCGPSLKPFTAIIPRPGKPRPTGQAGISGQACLANIPQRQNNEQQAIAARPQQGTTALTSCRTWSSSRVSPTSKGCTRKMNITFSLR